MGVWSPNLPEVSRGATDVLQRDPVIAELAGDEDFDQVVETDRVLAVDDLVIALEHGAGAGVGGPPAEPLCARGRVQAGESCGLANVIDPVSEHFHGNLRRNRDTRGLLIGVQALEDGREAGSQSGFYCNIPSPGRSNSNCAPVLGWIQGAVGEKTAMGTLLQRDDRTFDRRVVDWLPGLLEYPARRPDPANRHSIDGNAC